MPGKLVALAAVAPALVILAVLFIAFPREAPGVMLHLGAWRAWVLLAVMTVAFMAAASPAIPAGLRGAALGLGALLFAFMHLVVVPVGVQSEMACLHGLEHINDERYTTARAECPEGRVDLWRTK